MSEETKKKIDKIWNVVISQYLIYSVIERSDDFDLDNVYNECGAFMEYSKDSKKENKKNV